MGGRGSGIAQAGHHRRYELALDRALLRPYQPRSRAAARRVAQRTAGDREPRPRAYAAMEQSGNWDGVAQVTLEAAKRLEAAGAEGVIISSNTGHKVYDAIAPTLGVPMLHIADATADKLVAEGRKRVALLGTRFTMTEPHIRSRLESRGIRLVPIDGPRSARSTGSSSTSSRPAASSATASASSRR